MINSSHPSSLLADKKGAAMWSRSTARLLCALTCVLSLNLATSPDEAQAEEPDAPTGVKQNDLAQEVLDALKLEESPSIGPKDAPVTILVFSDYQCPFCSKAEETLAEIRARHGDDVRFVFKQMPLAMHKQAEEASRAAIAAWKQGGFEAMHVTLFAKQGQFTREASTIDAYLRASAEFMGLDLERFDRDYDAKQTRELIARDKALAKKLGVRGTPHFFINGKRLSGARPLESFEDVIEAELRATRELRSEKLPASQLHARRFVENFSMPTPPPEKVARPIVRLVPIDGDEPIAGAQEDYLVTVVVFSDFQCPFCRRAASTMDAVEKTYEGKPVRFVFKHLPLTMHKQALPAAKAAAAAHRQGKFWVMHDELFLEQSGMKSGNAEYFIARANAAGLDVKRFERAMKSEEVAREIEEDIDLAKELGVRGTPNFFVNGVQVTGARPQADFERLIDEQLARSARLKKEKKIEDADALYKAMVRHNEETPGEVSQAFAPSQRARARHEAPKRLDEAQLATLRGARGIVTHGDPAKARVVIYEFSDLQCPFCARAHDTILELVQEHDDAEQLAVVTFHYPLPFHKQAIPAHKALLAAANQGKGAAMQALLFKHQQRFKSADMRALMRELARELELDLDTFEADFDARQTGEKIEEDMALGKALDVRGTPQFFVNDRRVSGAQPLEKFEEAVEEASKK